MTIPKSPRGSAKAKAVNFVGTDGQKYFNTGHSADLYNVRPEATTTQLVDIADPINTSADKVLGRAVLNTTTGVTVFASGALDGSVWHYYDSTTAHTPV